ncbi:MAG: crosslink repair DNA glycosylase YcaQ family protein, partial [Bacillota bacterium]|nr:crosslink repair DNA glycosylase YcaQ family protein [Bacillota bacterium]
DPEEADAARIEKYARAYRLLDTGDSRFGWSRMPLAERRELVRRRVREGGWVELDVEGARGPYYVRAEDLERLREHERDARDEDPGVAGPVRFLPPLDNLLWRRERVAALFDFAYSWEVYLPAAKRRYGYHAMPILAGDRLVGRIDPRLDRQQRRLVVRLLQLEPWVKPTRELKRALKAGLEEFARAHGAGTVAVERTEPGEIAL